MAATEEEGSGKWEGETKSERERNLKFCVQVSVGFLGLIVSGPILKLN